MLRPLEIRGPLVKETWILYQKPRKNHQVPLCTHSHSTCQHRGSNLRHSIEKEVPYCTWYCYRITKMQGLQDIATKSRDWLSNNEFILVIRNNIFIHKGQYSGHYWQTISQIVLDVHGEWLDRKSKIHKTDKLAVTSITLRRQSFIHFIFSTYIS